MKPVTLVIIAIMVLVKLYIIGSSPTPKGNIDYTSWEYDLAIRLGNNNPSPEVLSFIKAWQRAEGSSASFNPLNTTYTMPGNTCFNIDPCVKNYLSYEDGMEATIQTLLGDYPGYSDIVYGIQNNDINSALYGLRNSPWGTNSNLVEQILGEMSSTEISSSPIEIDDSDFGYNIRSALVANSNALQDFSIAPGESWSFNVAVGDPRDGKVEFVSVSGVPGGGWCNLAARYAQVARKTGAELAFLHHNQDLGAGIENDVLIWNTDGTAGFEAGRQDLIITNNTTNTIRFYIRQINDYQVVVVSEII